MGKTKRILQTRQAKLLKKLSENLHSAKPKSLSVLCEESGYPKSTSQHPTRIMRTQSFQMALLRAGLDEELITREYKKAVQEKPRDEITWESKRKYLADLVRYLDIEPKDEIKRTISEQRFFAKIEALKEDDE